MLMRSALIVLCAVSLFAQSPDSYRVRIFKLKSIPLYAPLEVQGASVTSAFFKEAKVQPMLGRLFLPREFRPGAPHVVALSHRFWLKRFGGDPALIGRTVQLNAENFTIVGVMPETFDTPAGTDMWIPDIQKRN